VRRTTLFLLLMTMLTVPARASNRMLATEFAKGVGRVDDTGGIKTFFAPDCKVELRVDGAEI
jgi:hypothetical protein